MASLPLKQASYIHNCLKDNGYVFENNLAFEIDFYNTNGEKGYIPAIVFPTASDIEIH